MSFDQAAFYKLLPFYPKQNNELPKETNLTPYQKRVGGNP